ncbi:MAG TPA: hypothetical protein VGD67_10600 [Pseudonocardiaceae bacterium]
MPIPVVEPAAAPTIRRRYGPQAGLAREVGRLRLELAEAAEYQNGRRQYVLDDVRRLLDDAEALLVTLAGAPWPRRLGRRAKIYEAVLAHLQRAGEELYLVSPPEAVLARLPGLKAAVRQYLGPENLRAAEYLTLCDEALRAGAVAEPPKTAASPPPAVAVVEPARARE